MEEEKKRILDCNDFQGEDFEKLAFYVIMRVRKEGKVKMGSGKGYTHNDLINTIKFTLEQINKK